MKTDKTFTIPDRVRYDLFEFMRTGVSTQELQKKFPELKLTSKKIEQLQNGKEYADYVQKAEEYRQSHYADRITAVVLDKTLAISDVTDAARYELAQMIRKLIPETFMAEDITGQVKLVHQLTQSLSALTARGKEQKLDAAEAELLELRTQLAEQENTIQSLRKLLASGDTEKVIDAMNREVGVL